MVEKDKVFEGKIKNVGVFDFKELYRFLFIWLNDEGYFLIEKSYTEKISDKGKEVEIEWQAYKKISDYFRFNFKIKWLILGMTNVTIEDNGKKVNMNKGSCEIKLQAVLEKDYEHRCEGFVLWKFLRGLYDKYIIKGRIDAYEEKIFIEGDEFLAQAKSFLAIEGKH